MKVDVVEAVAVTVVVVAAVGMAAVMEVDMIAVMELGMTETLAGMRIHLVTVELVVVKVRLEKLTLGGLLNDVVVMAGHRVVSVVSAVVVIVTGKRGRGTALVGCLSVGAGQDEGNLFSLIIASWTSFFCIFIILTLAMFTVDAAFMFSNADFFLHTLLYVCPKFHPSMCSNEYKREGSGRGNWGSQTDELSQ